MTEQSSKKWIYKIFNLDRRIVYVFMLLAVSLPFFLKPVVSMKTTKWVESTYDLIEEAARRHRPILIGFDYDPSTLAELQPMAEVLLRHAFSKGVKVLGINFMPNGTSLAATTIEKIAGEYGKKNGEDYVFLGYLPQFSVVILSLGNDLRNAYKKDYRGIDIDKIPMLKNLQNFDDFQVVFSISGTRIPEAYIVWGVNRFNFNFVAGVTAVSATEYFPYLQTGQMKGLLAGMKAAAEYEGLSNHLGDGMRGMASQTWGHLVIILFIVFGNILYYVKQRMENKEKQGV